jgi:metal-responsive CopG/Arc/MetJ family transcriptional regulator
MKVAISLPDDVFEEGEALSRQLKTSRSQLYARALREFASRHNPDALTAAIDEALIAAGDEDADFAKEAGRRIIAQTDW